MKYSLIKEVIEAKKPLLGKSKELFRLLLKDQQREIFDKIPIGEINAVSCNFIKNQTGIPTKNIAGQIKQLSVNYPIGIVEVNRGKNKYYKKE